MELIGIISKGLPYGNVSDVRVKDGSTAQQIRTWSTPDGGFGKGAILLARKEA